MFDFLIRLEEEDNIVHNSKESDNCTEKKKQTLSASKSYDRSIYKNLIKAGFYLKKTSMCSLLKFQVLIIKDNVFTHGSKVKRFFFPLKKEKKTRLS